MLRNFIKSIILLCALIALNSYAAEPLHQPDMMSWKRDILHFITNPTFAYILLILGIYGIFFELAYPGFILPGVIGVLSFVVALYGLQYLPINYVGLGLILFGILFMITEGFIPSFGILGMTGTVAFIAGSMILIHKDDSGYMITWSIIWSMALFNLFFFILVGHMALKARNKKVQHGLELLVGKQGRALGEVHLEGQAVIRGEIWSVRSKQPIAADKKIKVLKTDGLMLEVEEDSQAS